MILHMQRAYGIRHVMVESGHITLEQFMGELLDHIQSKGMLPPSAELTMGGNTYRDNYWEPEEICPVVKAYKDKSS